MIRGLFQSPFRGVATPIPNLNEAFSLAAFFDGGVSGLAIIPSPANCFQDVAGTVAAAVGDPVALCLDQSGSANDVTQATLAERPILRADGTGRHYLEFSGGQSLSTAAALPFAATGAIALGFQVEDRLQSFTNIVMHRGGSAGETTRQPLIFLTQNQEVVNVRWGTGGMNVVPDGALEGAPLALATSLRVGGVAASYSQTISETSGGYMLDGGAGAFVIGGPSQYHGRIYAVMYRGAAATDAELLDMDEFVGNLAGV